MNSIENGKYPWCWLSLAEYLTGRLLEMSIPDAQSQSAQNQLRESSIQHIALSAEVIFNPSLVIHLFQFAVNADNEKDRKSLVLQAAEGSIHFDFRYIFDRILEHFYCIYENQNRKERVTISITRYHSTFT